MRGETLIPQPPPTPPEAGTEFRPKVQQITPYNTPHMCPSRDTSQESMRLVVQEGVPSYWSDAGSHLRNGLGLGVQLDEYGPVTEYYQDGEYYSVPGHPGTFAPLTPRSTIDDDTTRRVTRNGRAPAPPSPPQNREQSPRPKLVPRSRKTKAEKGDKSNTPKLTAPLSILTNDLGHIAVKNMAEWVNRSVEARHSEVEKRNGYITRPMNSFMLYRSAYADRAKAWCSQNNHQIVSSVAGESWPMEPPEIRDLYNDYARIERQNHAIAHPAYKFSPSKTPTPAARKRKSDWSDDDEPSDLEDSEWTASRATSRSRQIRRLERPLSCPNNGLGVELYDRSYEANDNNAKRASWQMTNDGRTMPTPMGPSSMGARYYQAAPYPLAMDQNFAGDMQVRKASTPVPSLDFQTNQALLALPGGNANGPTYQLPTHTRLPFSEGPFDPVLLSYENGTYSHVDPVALQQHEFRNGRPSKAEEEMAHFNFENILEMQPQHHYEYQIGTWHSDQALAPMEQELEFDKWMGEH